MPANRENVDAAKEGSTGHSREADKSHRDTVRDLINDVGDVLKRGEDTKWKDHGNTPDPPRTGEHPGRDHSGGRASDDIHDGPRREHGNHIDR